MLGGLLAILLCQLLGEVFVRLTGVPVPAPVIGMVLFLVVLRVRRPVEGTGPVRAADALLSQLGLFFVPAGVGVIVHLAALRAQWLPVAGGLLGSWLVGLVVTAGVALLLADRSGGAAGDGEGARR